MDSNDDRAKPKQLTTPSEHSPEAKLRRLRNMRRAIALYLEKGEAGIHEHLETLKLERAGVQDYFGNEKPN